MTAEGQSDKMASDMEVCMKQRCVFQFLHAKKIAPKDIHRHLLNVYRDQTLDVNTVRRWVERFSSGDNNVKDKPRSGQSCTAVTPQNEKHLNQLIHANQQITTRELCKELNIAFNAFRNDGGNLGISQSLCQVGPRNIKNTIYKFVRTY